MVVAPAPEDFRLIDRGAAVERDDQRLRRVNRLQDVHAVTDRAFRLGIGRHVRVPCRPGLAIEWKQARVGVQHHVVALVRHRAEDRAFVVRRIGEETQCLVAVAGEDQFIEGFVAARARYYDRIAGSADARHRTRKAFLDAPARAQFFHVRLRTALDHAPRRPAGDLHHLVVDHEADQVLHRKL